MRLLAISGSLRGESHNTKLLRAAATTLPPGSSFDLLDPEVLRAIPAYDEDHEKSGLPTPFAVAQLKAAIAGADGVLFATPEYNGSIPGALKNALDWASRPLATSPLKAKPVAVVGSSTGLFGAVWAQAELRKVLAASGARVLEEGVSFAKAPERIAADGGVHADDAVRLELAMLLGLLSDAAREPVEAAAGA